MKDKDRLKLYDERCYEILDKYFGKIPRDNNKLIEWYQEKINQGYLITVGADIKDIFKDNQIHFLTIKYDKEIVLREIVSTLDIKYIYKEDLKK